MATRQRRCRMSPVSRRIPTRALLRATGVLAACLALAAAPAAPAAAAAAAVAEDHAQPIEIGAARNLPLGTVVTVEGSVTVPSGDFSSSSFDEGFAIQDHTGGIYVSVATNLGLTVRERVLVTGQLVDSFGLLTLVPAAARDVHARRGHGRRIQPRWGPTGSVGPPTQGRLAHVAG